MVDAQKLLDQFLGTGRSYGTAPRPQQPGFGGGGGSIQDTLARTLGGALGGTGARSGGGIGDLIGGVLSGSRSGSGSGSGGSFGGSLAGKAIGGALAGGLASKILGGKRGKGLGGSALKLGGLALVAGLGYKAWQNYQAQQQAHGGVSSHAGAARLPHGEIPHAAGTRFHPDDGTEAERRARLLLSAMIAAAKADGYIDRAEEEAIFGRIDDLDLDAEEKGLLMDEMRRPMSIDEIAAQARDRETAIEVYTASVLAIDADHPAERAYLDYLAARLDLPAELVAEIRRAADEVQA